MSELDQVKASLSALEAQRHVLGDAVADQAIEALRRRLDELEKSRVQDEGERKHITVMFADLSGFTRLSEKGDAEEIRGWLNACFAELAAVVRRYGGYIDKFIGDELMVLFGAPQAMEDHASRALHAALDMRTALGRFNEDGGARRPDVSMHFGINSGVVIAGAMGVEGRREYTVMGDAVNVAARLASRAESGQILIAAGTRRLAGDDFSLREVGSTTVEGRERPVEVFELIDRKDAEAGPGEHLAGSTMVGRDWEMHALREIFDEVLTQRRARSVSIVGLAGIGKSRLLREFLNWIEDSQPATTLLIGEALPHMKMTPYFLIASAIRNALEVREGESAEAMRARLQAALADVNMLDADHLRAIEATMGIQEANDSAAGLAPQDLKARIFTASAAAIRALVQSDGAVVVALEDLHWADDLSIELLEHAFATLVLVPVLFVTTQRPIDDEKSVAQHLEARLPRDTHTRMVLSELDPSASESLVCAMAPGIERSAHGVDVIVRKSQGNPFFMQSIVAALQDRGIPLDSSDGALLARAIESADVPDTVWDVLADRIDRLPAEGKRVVQMASITGRNFWEGLVEELTGLPAGRHLQTLTQRELVDRLGRAAFAEEWEWTFRHVLVQEVAYSGLLRETRRAGHLVAAEWLERRVGDRLAEYATLLAYHYQKAEDWAKTAQFAEAAGDRAVSLFAHREAKDAYIQALDSLRQLPENDDTRRQQIDVTLKLADVTFYMPIEEVHGRLQHAGTLAEALGEPDRKLRVDAALASWLYVAGETAQAVELAQRCVASADPSQERLLEVPFRILGSLALAMGEFTKSIELLERAEAVADPNSRNPARANAAGRTRGFLGMVYALSGELAKGERLANEALSTAEAAKDVRQTAAAHMYLAVLSVAQGRTEGAGEHLEAAVRLSEEIGDPTQTYLCLGWLGHYHALEGRLTEAAGCLDRSLAIADGLDTVLFVSIMQALRAEVDVRAGRPELALPRAEAAVISGKATGQQSCEAEAYRVLGWSLFFAKPEARAEAEHAFRQAAEIHKRGHAMGYYTHALTDFAAYLHLVGEKQRAAEIGAEAAALIGQYGLTWMPVAPPIPSATKAAST